MHLEHLFDTVERYVEGPHILEPHGGVEGIAFGRGEATVEGERIAGRLEWTNLPRRREDGVWCPNLTGHLVTDDGADVFVRIEGYSLLTDGGRELAGTYRFVTEDPAYAWLNTVVGVYEGRLEPDATAVTSSVYECVPDRPAAAADGGA